MQTAVQKLIEELLYHLAYDDDLTEESRVTLEKVVDKCKGKLEMEKQHIKHAWYNGAYGGGQFMQIIDNAEQYYNETYGSKGSDEIKKAEEMGLYDKIELANPNDSIFTSSQTEISDEEIEEESWRYREVTKYIEIPPNEDWSNGAKWYREQLKKKQ